MRAEDFDITLRHDSEREQQTRSQLQRLLGAYDLVRWIETRTIVIEERSIPHSHPNLTLNTRHLEDDDLLLATFIHEQIHWFLLRHQRALAAAIKEIRILVPEIPVGFPQGADSRASSYLHVIVNFLEWEAIDDLLGSERAQRVMEFWMHDHYRAIYRLVLDLADSLRGLVDRHGLRPHQTV